MNSPAQTSHCPGRRSWGLTAISRPLPGAQQGGLPPPLTRAQAVGETPFLSPLCDPLCCPTAGPGRVGSEARED